jgi:hypothetical protein
VDGWRVSTLYRYNIETHDVTGIAAIARIEHSGRTDDFALLMAINGMARLREFRRGSITDLHERQAPIVQHDQVDFTTAATKVARNRSQALLDEVVECRAFRAVA